MKTISKKITMGLMAICLTLVATLTSGAGQASAATSDCATAVIAGGTHCLTTSQDNYSIFSSFQSSPNSHVNVKFVLQESTNETWTTKQTIYGGLASAGSSVHVSFNNYSTAGTRYFRVLAYVYSGWSGYTNYLQLMGSKTFTR